ncbi:MAG: GNAT family N-acetyltransferase [Pseudomonadota bacterium]
MPDLATNAPSILPATAGDSDAIWAILEPVIRAGETWALDRDMSRAAALAYWFAADRQPFVSVENDEILGSYFIRANHPGPGAHIANAGYMTAQSAQGRGVGRAMCAHSLDLARTRGFRAMQFNFVVSTNTRAIALWQAMGFGEIGRTPGGFDHPRHGPVDSLMMFRKL